jgi:hypothetical protein
VLLFNAATTLTLLIGVVSLYVALVLLALAGAGVFITPDALSTALDEDVGFADYLKLVWFASSLATVGGALGASLETDAAVREAAYAYRPEDED